MIGTEFKMKNNRVRTADELLAYAGLIVPQLIANMRDDVMAICSKESFDVAIQKHMDSVKAGNRRKYDKVIAYVLEGTCTFAGTVQTQRPIHIGIQKNLDALLSAVLIDPHGFNMEEICLVLKDRHLRQQIFEELYVRDSRLYVPFAGEYSKEWDMYVNNCPSSLVEAEGIIRSAYM